MKNTIFLRVLLENQVQENIEDEFKKLAGDIAKGIEASDELKKESAVAITISALFAIPAIINAVGSFIKLFMRVIKFGKGEKTADKIIHFGEKLEGYFTAPIAAALKKFANMDDKKAKENAHLIHKSIIFILLVISGIGFAKAVSAAKIPVATAEGVLSAIKGTELGKFLVKKS